MARRQEESTGPIKVEVAVTCSGLRERDRFSRTTTPVCILYMKSRGSRQWKEVGRTERIEQSLDPEWAKTFEIEYYFEEKQELRFAIYDWEKNSRDPRDQDPMGSVECTLAEVLAAKGRFQRGLSPYMESPGDCGILGVYAEEQTGFKDKIKFEFTGSNLDKKDLFSESDPFFTISRYNPDGTHTIVYRSEWVKDNPNPEWAPVEITSLKLCNGDWSRPLKVEVYDYNSDGDHDFIGEYTTTLEEMGDGEGFQIVTWDVINSKKKVKKGDHYENSGTVILKSIEITQDTTFLDYIRGGLKLHFVVAVDFTMSNGDPNDPSSLHYLDAQRVENPYTMAIKTVGDIFQDYDFDRRFLALGFGGVVNGRVSHCFPLNGNSREPYCYGIGGIIDAYYDSLENVPLSDPTCYAPVVDYVRTLAETMDDGRNYVVLLIITDGGISDIEATKRLLVQCANNLVPLSLILVGVGSGDMTDMDLLDADRQTLSYRGVKAKRDIVQFVDMPETQAEVIKASKTPMSIMILRVGDRDRKDREIIDHMKLLDDETVEKDKNGKRKTRDIVDYLEMSKYIPEGGIDPKTFHSVLEAANIKYYLAKDVLAEVPYQVAEYMTRKGFKAGVPDVETALKMDQLNLRG